MAALRLDHSSLAPEIGSGVPALASRESGHDLRLALKSGNFGAVDIYEKALRAMEAA